LERGSWQSPTIALVENRIAFKIQFIVEIEDSFGQKIFYLKIKCRIIFFVVFRRLFSTSLPHIDVQNDIVEIRVLRMTVALPIGGIDMQFDIPVVDLAVDFDGCAGEVGSFAKIPVAGVDDFQILIVLGFELGSAKQLVVQDAADYLFWDAYRVVFFSNFKLI
jgi:hypothetical protein